MGFAGSVVLVMMVQVLHPHRLGLEDLDQWFVVETTCRRQGFTTTHFEVFNRSGIINV